MQGRWPCTCARLGSGPGVIDHSSRIALVLAPLTPAPFDHWPRYQELSELLQRWAAERPQLLTVVSIGHSHEGRDIWMCEVTDAATGPARDKPAVWVDANIHATEMTGGAAALHL